MSLATVALQMRYSREFRREEGEDESSGIIKNNSFDEEKIVNVKINKKSDVAAYLLVE